MKRCRILQLILLFVVISFALNTGCNREKTHKIKSEISKSHSDHNKATLIKIAIGELFKSKNVTLADLKDISTKHSISLYIDVQSKYFDIDPPFDPVAVYEEDWTVLMIIIAGESKSSVWKVWPEVALISSPS